MKSSKKGQAMQKAVTAVIALLVIVVFLALAAFVLSEVKSSVTLESEVILNETLTTSGANNTAYSFAHPPIDVSSAEIYNSSGSVITATNYSITDHTVTIIDSGKEGGNVTGLPIFANYSYNQKNYAYNTTGEAEKGTEQYANLTPVLAITLVVVLIITLLAGLYFVAKRE